jgi:hypothetical protein
MNVSSGACAECGQLVLIRDDGERWYACDGHEDAGVVVNIASTLIGTGGVSA